MTTLVDKNTTKEVVSARFLGDRVLTDATDRAKELYEQSCYGALLDNGILQLSHPEALYLLEKKRITILHGKKKVTPESFLKYIQKKDDLFWTRYCVFKDLRDRGYIVKTALKFGADFRVYDRGIKPGEDHAKWVVFPQQESSVFTWYEFSAKNRVAHSTRKRLLIGIVDDEGDVTYYEVKWIRP
ncbi:MAG: tRNA-intron lyase [Nanoarchaeota archaeon]